MKCPFCHHKKTRVLDKRETTNLESTRRRRKCLHCKKRFTTYERIEKPTLTIIKKDNRKEPFDKQKIKQGILKACEKRPVSEEKITKIVDEIEIKLKSLNKIEVPAKIVGKLVIKKLKALDKVAYLRFVSVYKEFEDITKFEEEAKKLSKKK